MYQIEFTVGLGLDWLGNPLKHVEEKLSVAKVLLLDKYGAYTTFHASGEWKADADADPVAEDVVVFRVIYHEEFQAHRVADTLRSIFMQQTVLLTVQKLDTGMLV